MVIMPGGFHPFHAGHLALYQQAKKAFPNAEVFVAATNDTSERPFPFAVKEKLAKLAGVSPNRFYKVKSPFRAEEITKNFDPNTDQLIFVRSEKDANKPPQAGGVKKDGSPAYLQPLMGAKQLESFARHAYMAYLPTVEFGPGMTSATEIRRAWPQLNDRRKTALVMSLYPLTQADAKLAATVVQMLDVAILGSVQENQGWAATYTSEQTRAYGGQQGAGMTAAYQRRENQPVDEDYIEEKWSEKYKNSINCASPRGFSQRAHCAGRRKNEGVAEGSDDDIWGPRGNFAGDKHVDIGGVTMKIIQVGDTVKYLGQQAKVVAMSKDRKYSRISIGSGFGGSVKDVLTADLKQLGQGVAEGATDTIYPNAEVIKSKNGRPVGEIYQDENGWGCFHYRADRGYDMIDSREDAIQALKDLHQETGRSGPDYTFKGVAEGLDAEAYKQKLLSSLPGMMQFFAKNVQGWRPSREQMLAAIETGYTVMQHTGDVKQAGRAVMDELNTLHRMSQGEQGVAEAQLAEKCWDTHRQAGMKKKGNRMVPNCVPK